MLHFVTDTIGVGQHGLLRMLTSDWDDGIHPPPEAYNTSESVLTAALAAYVLPRFGQVR